MSAGEQLEAKVALVTGASRGIGLAIARSLAKMGARLCICARDAKRLGDVAKDFNRAGSAVLAVPADLTRSGDIPALVRKTEQSLGPIDVLVNNAGVGYFGPTHEASEANWDSVLDTNLKAAFLLSSAVAHGMIRRRSGHIVNIASLAGKNAFAGGGIYCASKWGLLGLTECMAEDLRPHGIRVSAICPGTVETDFSPHGKKDPRKMLQPEDVAHAVEMILAQAPQSFISEVLLRPTMKP
ncbi:MAG TPA: SDR family NAD(P)-dependent oxidoreductase [Candidatus Acidoferrales bacterium]|nr:SDR family NAD(P)-dependent oxidoreductase [Candidatus Acidoferrales bacterium]